MAKNTENALRVCPHGSTYCFCKHNLASAIALPGRPKYGPKVSRGNKPKATKKKGSFDSPTD